MKFLQLPYQTRWPQFWLAFKDGSISPSSVLTQRDYDVGESTITGTAAEVGAGQVCYVC